MYVATKYFSGLSFLEEIFLKGLYLFVFGEKIRNFINKLQRILSHRLKIASKQNQTLIIQQNLAKH